VETEGLLMSRNIKANI